MQYITTQKELLEATKHMGEQQVLAVDLECENNLHHYGTYISLIQVSCQDTDWIVDVLELKTIDPLLEVFANPSIKKVFHDVSFDLRILHLQFGCRPKNLFDTQLGALFLGKTEIGLGALLKEYYGVQKERKYQMADWTKRPLDQGMLSYATKDTKHLLPLYFDIKKELEEKERFDWVLEECQFIEESEMTYKENEYTDFKGFRFLPKKKQAILKNLFELREEVAQKVDMPNYFVMSNARIQEILDRPPLKIEQWKHLKAVHPAVKRNAKRFLEAVTKFDVSQLPETKKHPKYTPEQKEKTYELGVKAQSVAERLGIRKHLVMNKDQIQDIVLNNNYDSLRDWQKKLVL
ncbi:MAG: HRDC domain-containing protein [Nanoarchaeota archaeon]|nr:HRDC domain-containing protein [Nanoarchaeota archaeon]